MKFYYSSGQEKKKDTILLRSLCHVSETACRRALGSVPGGGKFG